MRMARNSTLFGLQGMKQSSLYESGEVCLMRPFLNFTKDRIISTCKENQWKWWEDKSNSNTKYTRNYIREKMNSEFDFETLHSIFKNTCKVNEEMESQILSFLQSTSLFYWKFGAFSIDKNLFQSFDDNITLQTMGIRWALNLICRRNIRTSLLEELITFMRQKHAIRNKFSISGIVVSEHKNSFYFVHETNNVAPVEIKNGSNVATSVELDKKFVFFLCEPNVRDLQVSYIDPFIWGKVKRKYNFVKIPKPILSSLVVITYQMAPPHTNVALPQMKEDFPIACFFKSKK